LCREVDSHFKPHSLKMKDAIIIGGGLAGLISAIELAKADLKVLLIEKKHYPFHRVCGEYISNEVLPYLKSLAIFPEELGASNISELLLSAPSGKVLNTTLDLGGFGVSRYTLDYFLYKKALAAGAEVMTGKEVEKVIYQENTFSVKLSDGTELESKVVIGAHGKRSKLDKTLDRDFINKRSPYVGVKYHIKTDFPKNLIALHNFKDGYCGISKVEGDTYNLCYLSHRNNLRDQKNIKEMEKALLFRNPFLKDIFQNAQFLFEKPEVINEISFEKKELVEDHILMVGDSAGMITPLCGNGMAMAIHGAKIASQCVIDFTTKQSNRDELEKTYSQRWNNKFAARLFLGRNIQRLFGKEVLSEVMVNFLKKSKPLTRFIIKQTHGEVF